MTDLIWRFDPTTDTLSKDGRPIAYILPAAPGHVVDTGRLIAELLTRWEREGRKTIAAPAATREKSTEKEPLRSMLERARNHVMTDEEIAVQRDSWTRQDKD